MNNMKSFGLLVLAVVVALLAWGYIQPVLAKYNIK